MKLGQNIQACRKRAGLSQEALAEKLGVSRQAISKWELGEAEPELKNLQLLAKVFGVSVDYLLNQEPTPAAAPATRAESWIDSLPRLIGNLLRRYGWLAGVYIAAAGGFWTLGCGLLRGFFGAAMKTMQQTQEQFTQQFPGLTDGVPGLTDSVLGSAAQAQPNPAFQFFNGILVVMMLVGIAVTIAGIFLAWKLKKLSKTEL